MILSLVVIECQMRFKIELSKKTKSITSEYKDLYAYFTKELHIEALDMAIMGLIPWRNLVFWNSL